MYVAAGMREAGAHFQGRFPGNEPGHAWRNNPNGADMRHIGGIWRGKAEADDIWRESREDGVYRHRLASEPLADRVPRTLAMADVHEHPLRVSVHVPHGKGTWDRSRNGCGGLRDENLGLGKRHLDATDMLHEVVGD